MSARANRLAALLGLGLLLLAGCSNRDGNSPLELQVVSAARAAISNRNAVKTPVMKRAFLDTVNGALLEVTLERRDQRAYLYVSAQRQDSAPGQIVVWRTGDNVTLAMRNGVLFSTRGLGGDILSGRVQVADGVPGPSAGGEKSFDIRAHDNKALHLSLACDVVDLGAQTIEIIDRLHPTRLIRETCEGGQAGDGTGRPGQVVNEYWIDTRAGLVWQSRQWAGPEVGYLFIRQVNR